MTKNIDKNSILIRIFFLTIMVFLKVVLIHVILILMMLVKFATLGFLEKQVFWNKVYDIIMWVCEVVNKILLRDSNYIASKTLGPKFGNSSISVKEVIITLILYGFDQKKFRRAGLSSSSVIRTSLGMASSLTNGLTKSQKVLIVIPNVRWSYKGKTGRRVLSATPHPR